MMNIPPPPPPNKYKDGHGGGAVRFSVDFPLTFRSVFVGFSSLTFRCFSVDFPLVFRWFSVPFSVDILLLSVTDFRD